MYVSHTVIIYYTIIINVEAKWMFVTHTAEQLLNDRNNLDSKKV